MHRPAYKLVFCYPSTDKENKGTELLYSPLALAYMARHTPDNYEMSLYDEYVGEDLDPITVDADIVAMSALSSGIHRSYQLADQLRARGITCVIGGAHATALPDETLEHFDTVIIGEGEVPWRQFLADYEAGSPKPTYFGRMDVALDNLGTPDRRYIHPNYHYPSVMTSRGCPYHCSFCYLTVYKHRKFRTIPHETILQDLDSLRDESVVIITDENFMGYQEADIEDRKILLRKMIQRGYPFFWGCQTTVKLAEEPELMELMYRAGCRAVFVGFEATDEESLKFVNKKQNMGVDYRSAIKKIHRNKIAVIASTILGMDNHHRNYHKTLIREIKKVNADFVRVFYMTAWPGTPLYKKLSKEGRTCNDWRKLRKDIPTVEFKHYTHEEAIAARKAIMDSFFNFRSLSRVALRWIFVIDWKLIRVFLKMSFRNRKSERIRNRRAAKKIGPSDTPMKKAG